MSKKDISYAMGVVSGLQSKLRGEKAHPLFSTVVKDYGKLKNVDVIFAGEIDGFWTVNSDSNHYKYITYKQAQFELDLAALLC